MKKITFRLLLLVLALMPLAANADTHLVNNGTATNTYFPLYFYNTDNQYYKSQFTYTSGEMNPMQNKVITAMKFYLSGTASQGSSWDNMRVKLKVGTASSASFTTDTWKTDNLNTVLYGKVQTNGNELTIYFNTGFYYTSGAFLVEIESLESGAQIYWGNQTGFLGANAASGNYSAWKGGSSYPVTGTPTTTSFSPKTQFTYYNPSSVSGYVSDYSFSSHSWLTLNGDHKNMWVIGDSAHTTIGYNNSIYVTGHKTNGNRYVISGNNVASTAFAYRFVELESNTQYTISYDWRCAGEGSYDYLRVALVPVSNTNEYGMVDGTTTWTTSSLPNGVIPLDGGSKLNNKSSWQHHAQTFTTGSATSYKLVLFWNNDNSGGTQPPAAVDRITICPLSTASFYDDFEAGDAWLKWASDYTYSYNGWGIGTYAYRNGSKSMYIGTDASHGYDYDNTDPCNTYTYVPMRMKAGRYLVSYDWKCQGESCCDYMKVGFAPFYANFDLSTTSMPSGTIYADGGSSVKLNNQQTWTNKTVIVNIPTDTVYNFFLFWHNDGSTGTDPAAVDNLSITPIHENNIEHAYQSSSYASQNGYMWTTTKSNLANYWNRGAYLQINNGSTYGYNSSNNSASTYAYAAVQLDAGDYDVSFRWMANGETNYDFLRVALVRDTTRLVATTDRPSNWNYNTLPSGAIACDGNTQLQGITTMTTASNTITVPSSGVWKLVFWWRNDGSGGAQGPARVDNITIVPHQTAQYTITVVANNNAYGSVSGSGTYDEGSNVQISATANSGYHFERWDDGNTDNPRTITVTADATYEAIFSQDAATQYTITVTSNNEDWGVVTGGGTYDEGTTATLRAYPADGYVFKKWSDNNTDNPRQVTVNGDASYQAIFGEKEGIESVESNDLINIYPNPANGIVNIAVEGVSDQATVDIIDLNGKTVMSRTVSSNGTVSMSLDGVVSGVYFVRFVNGSSVQLKKLVVK